MYILAAFLIISLIKIKRVLPPSEFNPKSMIIHIVSLSLQFGISYIGEMLLIFTHNKEIKGSTGLISYWMQSVVYVIECYIFKSICDQAKSNIVFDEMGEFKIKKKIKLTVDEPISSE